MGIPKARLVSKESAALFIIAIVAAILLWFGWRMMWFLTDDAYIAFRYVSNSHLGHGYVWNPPPFRPVEGYTSFLWVVLLDLVWRLVGVAPPDSANTLALLFTCLQLLIAAHMLLRWTLKDEYRSWRIAFLGLLLLGAITNRTFLAWASSGLETALFNCLVVFWLVSLTRQPRLTRAWFFWATLATALLALTRPDGILFLLVTMCLVVPGLVTGMRRKRLCGIDLFSVAPLLIIPLHFAWRYHTYGEWLPNTYYAKLTSPGGWTESGLRYATSFILEYGLWVWLILVLLGLIVGLHGAGSRISQNLVQQNVLDFVSPDVEGGTRAFDPKRMPFAAIWWMVLALLASCAAIIVGKSLVGALVLGLLIVALVLIGALGLDAFQTAVGMALIGHFVYYTFIVGGDHFEFRVYSHLVVLLLMSIPWLCQRLGLRARTALIVLSLAIFFSWPIPWMHYLATKSLDSREQTRFLKASVADEAGRIWPGLPKPLTEYFRLYDNLQFWLVSHAVCIRHQEHKVFHLYMTGVLPERETGSAMSPVGFPVFEARSAGIIAWVLPHVSIIDRFGLSDYVIARNRDLSGGRIMAHERKPPAGYVECFMPNVTIEHRRIIVTPRHDALTTERIVLCEQRYARQLETDQQPSDQH